MAERAPEPRTSRATARKQRRRRRNRIVGLVVVLCLLAVGVGGAWWWSTKHSASVSAGAPTTAPAPAGPTSSTTTTATTQPPGPGFVAGKVTGVGDSVMMDYQSLLEKRIPGIVIDGNVGRQWSSGEQLLAQQKAAGTLGAVVVVGLSTNGPITASMFDSMMSTLSGASRVVFVNVHVGQPWQDPNNTVLAEGVARYKNAVLADWNAVASEHPEWFGADGTHIAFSGPAPDALSKLIAAKITNG